MTIYTAINPLESQPFFTQFNPFKTWYKNSREELFSSEEVK